jgi:beta-glucanase (GH16 family)
MKAIFLLTAMLLSAVTQNTKSAPPEGNWTLTFEDEFESSLLDLDKWNIRSGIRRDAYWGAAGVISRGDGFLEISTRLVDRKVVSGSIDTKGRFEQRFGYFEARCRLPKVGGHWSAFWLLSRQFGDTEDARLSGAEVDIFEYHTLLGDSVHHAVHWPKYDANLKSRKKRTSLIHDGQFHVFGLLWSKEKYVFYVDLMPVWETEEGISEVAHYILLTNEVGAWAGHLNIDKLPDEMVCDYVRAYKLTN